MHLHCVACDSLRCVWVVCTLSLLLVGLRFCSCAVLDGHQSAVADDTSLQCGTRCCVFESLSERFKALVLSDFQRVEPVTATDSGGQVPGWLCRISAPKIGAEIRREVQARVRALHLPSAISLARARAR
jgi:hypothetical protein